VSGGTPIQQIVLVRPAETAWSLTASTGTTDLPLNDAGRQMPVPGGRLFELGSGSISTLGWKRELRVIQVWNDRAHLEQVAP
jgi:hypothetical protein